MAEFTEEDDALLDELGVGDGEGEVNADADGEACEGVVAMEEAGEVEVEETEVEETEEEASEEEDKDEDEGRGHDDGWRGLAGYRMFEIVVTYHRICSSWIYHA